MPLSFIWSHGLKIIMNNFLCYVFEYFPLVVSTFTNMEDLLVGYYLRRLVCFPWEVIGTNTCGGGYWSIHIV